MSETTAGLLQVGLLIAALAACYRPLGAYMARVYTSDHDLRAERVIYRLIGVDPKADQRWTAYARALLAFSAVSVLGLYALQRLQPHLPLSLGFPGVAPDQAFNTATSFVSNTNWQSYSGESTMGHLVQMSGLAVQNFVSAAVGMAVAVALIRGFARSRTDRLGNFWVDLVRGSLRILLPLAVVGSLALVALGAVQNFSARHRGHHARRPVADHPGRAGRVAGGDQGARHQRRRLLQRELRAPVREPERLLQPAGDLPAPAHPGVPHLHVRPDGQGQAAGVRDPRRDGRPLDGRPGVHLGAGGTASRHGAQPGRRVDGGQGDPVR